MRYFRIICFILLVTAAHSETQKINYSRVENGVVINLQPGRLKLQPCSENIIRVIYAPTDSFPTRESLMIVNNDWHPGKWHLKETKQTLSIFTPKLEVKFDYQTKALTFFDSDGNIVLSETENNSRKMVPANIMGEKTYHARQNFSLSEAEAIYGLGQFQDGVMNWRGHDVTLVQQNTVVVVPFFVSTKGYGILWDNYSMTKFHDSEEGTFLWSEVADAIDYYFIAGVNLDEVIAGYRYLTGRTPMFAKWAYGYWQSKERYWRQDEIINVVQEYRQRKIPLDVIVQDWTYWGDLGWNAIEFDRQRFPDPKGMLKTIHDLNTHYLISIWPNFDAKTKVYQEMDANSFIIHRKDGTRGRLYDAFNEKARQLYWEWLDKNLFSIGVDAWWMDATEPEFIGGSAEEIAAEAKKYKDTALGSWARYLNAFSLMSCKGVYEYQRQETEDKRVYILTRSAYAGQQRYAAVTWSGDIHATWQVFRNQISAGLNFCSAGIPYWTTDIGAFLPDNPLGCRDEAYREIYVRWFQFGTFCPMFRSHGSHTPREVWQFGDKGYWAYETLVRFDQLRYRLLPYIYSLAWKVTNEDYTIMRPLPFDFNEDAAVRNIDNQYMFGAAFLVNPVTERMYFENTYIGDLIPTENLFIADKVTNGLTAEFYNGQNFDTLVAKRVEEIIDFNWNDGSRPQQVNQHYYSIRFSGQVLSQEGGEYTFVTTSNDGIRLWIDDQLIIDNWTDHGVTINMGEIKLTANRRYNLKMEYYQTLGGAITKLAWITPNKAHSVRHQNIPPTKAWNVYLPKAKKWYDFWTGASVDGGQTIHSPAPIDIMPLYVRAGSIIPLGPYLQYAEEKPADPIELRIYRGANGDFTIYEDENDNYNYEKGVYATIPIKWNDATQTLTIGERRGNFPGMLKKRTFQIVWVENGHGIGVEPTDKPDKIINYAGSKLNVKYE